MDNSTFNDSYEKKIARHEVLINLEEICECAKKVLKDNGKFCIVHRSDRLMDVLEVFKNIYEECTVFILRKMDRKESSFY